MNWLKHIAINNKQSAKQGTSAPLLGSCYFAGNEGDRRVPTNQHKIRYRCKV